MAAQNLITQRDVIKKPQFVVEGTTAALYGVTPTNPVFVPIGRDATLVEAPTPTKAELRTSGNVDKQRNDLTREVNTVALNFKVTASDFDILKWFSNVPNGAITADETRSFIWSYTNNAGVETFQRFLGCQPLDSTITEDNEGYVIIDATLTCQSIVEDTTGPTIGSGSFATPLTVAPLTHKDSGATPFTYNTVVTEVENFAITVTFVYAEQNSISATQKLYSKPTQRVITGSSIIFKKNLTIQADAKAVTERAAIFVLKSTATTMTYTFAGFVFTPSGEEMSGDIAEATKENKSWESNTVVLA